MHDNKHDHREGWAPSDKAALNHHLGEGRSSRQIAGLMGRTLDAIRNARRRYGKRDGTVA